jgi:hypothetical protein
MLIGQDNLEWTPPRGPVQHIVKQTVANMVPVMRGAVTNSTCNMLTSGPHRSISPIGARCFSR